jgi:DNA-binding winged helix-turn-helix (wHTH) protein
LTPVGVWEMDERRAETAVYTARLKAILEHELRKEGRHESSSHIETVPRLGYLIAIGHGDNLTIRLVQEQV